MKSQKSRNNVKILGVGVDSTSINSVLREIQSRFIKNQKFYIVTPNPEQILLAQEDAKFRGILNSGNISIPDGIGLIIAHKFLSLPQTKTHLLKPVLYLVQGLGVGFSIFFDKTWLTKDLKPIRGRDLFLELVKLANKKRRNVCLVGDKLGSAQKAKEVLEKNYKGLRITSVKGPTLDQDGYTQTRSDMKVEKLAVDTINKVNPHFLFVGFGAPKQEKWLYRHFNYLSFKGAMVVGGTFDYISGKKSTPPKLLADVGLEWLWRIIIGDQKLERVAHAFPEFPLKVFWQKLTS